MSKKGIPNKTADLKQYYKDTTACFRICFSKKKDAAIIEKLSMGKGRIAYLRKLINEDLERSKNLSMVKELFG